MHQLLKKVHIYLSLICCTALLVYGIAGLWAFANVAPQDRKRLDPVTSTMSFTAPANATDEETARLIWSAIGEPITAPPPRQAVRRNQDGHLAFAVYSVNGQVQVVFDEGRRELRLRKLPNKLGGFFMALHEMAARNNSPDPRNMVWKYYNEFAMFSLILMVATGIYLWLASRPGMFWAQVSFSVGTIGFLALFWAAR
ncbi:MAG: hypothetical protein FJW39_25300 [Acidobacteria bacterium]|nr:hypothetical protein [Acidobacteriota bacterium]